MDWLFDLIIDGREVRFYAGRGGDNPWPRADFRQVNVALVQSVSGTKTARSPSPCATRTILARRHRRRADCERARTPASPGRCSSGCGQEFRPHAVPAGRGEPLTYSINDFVLDATLLNSSEDVTRWGLSLKTTGLFILRSIPSITANIATETLTYTAHRPRGR
jgi:hypothetical protein